MDALTFGRLRHFGRLDQWLLLLSIASSAAYMATRAVQPFPGSIALFLHLDARRYFAHALGAFLLAHVAYILLFTRNWPRPLRPSVGQVILAGLVLVYGLLVCAWLWTGLGRLLVPALAYAAAIMAMTVSTILAGFSRPFVSIGALLFLISDSLIAAGRFRMWMPLAALLIWPTYYLGQYGIAIGFLRETAAADRSPAFSD
jgi:uncharacterized membrane protein YhhN